MASTSTLDWNDVKIDLAPGEKKVFTIPFWSNGDLRALKNGHDVNFRIWLIEPDGFVSTSKDITVFNGNRTRVEAGVTFDVSPEPAYIDKKK